MKSVKWMYVSAMAIAFGMLSFATVACHDDDDDPKPAEGEVIETPKPVVEYYIKGAVTVKGEGKSGVKVKVGDKDCITDSKGEFSVTESNTGTYEVSVAPNGYLSQKTSVKIADNAENRSVVKVAFALTEVSPVKEVVMEKKSGILNWKIKMRALAMVICLALTMQFASGCGTTESAQSTQENATTIAETFDFAAVPAYDGKAYVAVNDNVPFFTEEELSSASYETYGELDPLGRCTVCVASVGQDLMPAEERGNIGAVKPTGWHTVKYDFVDGKYLYNRCHLIGYQLTGENANEKNLITGTRYLNIEGMLPFENMVADYVKETDQHVMYRVTPVFEGDNLLAAGVLMEGKSVEDNGEGVLFCVFAYNVQPGVSIDYATGESSADGTIVNDTSAQEETSQSEETQTYVLNTNTHKFHKPGCYSVEKIKPENYAEFTGTREEAIAYGYDPCKNCNP